MDVINSKCGKKKKKKVTIIYTRNLDNYIGAISIRN